MSQVAPHVATRPRWRFTFRLSTLFVVITIAAVACAWPRIYRQIQFWRFKTYVGRDLQHMGEQEQRRFDRIVASLVPPKEFHFDTHMRVWRVPTQQGERFVLYQGSGIFSIPDNAQTTLKVFDDSGNLLRETVIWVGWRIFPYDSEVITESGFSEPLFVVHSAPTINGADISRQVYALVNNRPELLRLEDSNGKLVPNAYAWPNHTIGSDAEPRTESQWVELLTRGDNFAVLQALVWIGGTHHGRPIRNPVGIHIEDYEQAVLHRQVCSRPEVVASLQKLSKDKHLWIAEAATKALQSLPQPASSEEQE